MRLRLRWCDFGLAVGAMLIALPALSQTKAQPQPLVIPLQCAGGDCPVLRGVPRTAGMRSGFVHLSTGATVGWNATGTNQESLVILEGQGEALIEGRSGQSFTAPALPILILHSRTDRMVPVTQALRMAEALQENGKVYALRVYEHDGHPLPQNRDDRDRMIVDWFNRFGKSS